jgi:hypothetical protein
MRQKRIVHTKTNTMDKKEKITWSSEHRRNNPIVMSAEERRVASMPEVVQEEVEVEEEEKVEEETGEENSLVVYHGEYQTPPVLDEEAPGDLPVQEEQDPPSDPEEEYWHCIVCLGRPCFFRQWQQEMERIVEILHSDTTNKSKRYHMYRHMSRHLHGPMGFRNRKRLPSSIQGADSSA